MHRIRFHGRGGQGMKTASRIVGTAAFREGYYAQDSPVYGAERRGAPVTAFTRFDSKPVLERGSIYSPDLVVIADASLLDDPMVRPLQGVSKDGMVLINAGSVSGVTVPFTLFDFTGLALHYTGSTSALSVALGAAGARLAGLGIAAVEQATSEELGALMLDAAQIDKNLKLARASFEAMKYPLAPASMSRDGISAGTLRVVDLSYDGPWLGTASVAGAPNTALRKTGDWRVMRPVIHRERCTHCWICFVNCPDGAITLAEGDVPEIDYGVCKGCLICAEECPVDAIESVRETEAPS